MVEELVICVTIVVTSMDLTVVVIDGSIMHFSEIETNFRKSTDSDLSLYLSRHVMFVDANNGVDEIVEEQRPFAIKHKVSFADLYVS